MDMEFSDVLLEPNEAAAFLKCQPLLVGEGACNERGAAVYPDWSLRSVQQGRTSSLAEVAGAVIRSSNDRPSQYSAIQKITSEVHQ